MQSVGNALFHVARYFEETSWRSNLRIKLTSKSKVREHGQDILVLFTIVPLLAYRSIGHIRK